MIVALSLQAKVQGVDAAGLEADVISDVISHIVVQRLSPSLTAVARQLESSAARSRFVMLPALSCFPPRQLVLHPAKPCIPLNPASR
jgi:hypothetical protein